MVTRTLDADTKAYFKSEAGRINFVGEDHKPDSIKRRLLDADIEITPTTVLQFREWAATVYQFSGSAVAALDINLTYNDNRHPPTESTTTTAAPTPMGTEPRPNSETNGDSVSEVFAAEWGIETEHDTSQSAFHYSTLFFSSTPTASDLEHAYELQSLKSALRFGQLEPTFHCKLCDEQAHWLSIPRKGPDPEQVPLQTRRALLEQRRCGCRGINKISATAQPEQELYEL